MEVFQDGERVFTSASHDTMDRIPSFTAESGGVLVALGTKVRGNIQVIVHHIRAIPIARKANMVSLQAAYNAEKCLYYLHVLCIHVLHVHVHVDVYVD